MDLLQRWPCKPSEGAFPFSKYHQQSRTSRINRPLETILHVILYILHILHTISKHDVLSKVCPEESLAAWNKAGNTLDVGSQEGNSTTSCKSACFWSLLRFLLPFLTFSLLARRHLAKRVEATRPEWTQSRHSRWPCLFRRNPLDLRVMLSTENPGMQIGQDGAAKLPCRSLCRQITFARVLYLWCNMDGTEDLWIQSSGLQYECRPAIPLAIPFGKKYCRSSPKDTADCCLV